MQIIVKSVPKRLGSGALDGVILLYFLSYVANVLLTRLATSSVHPARGRPLTGLEILPLSMLATLALTYLFIWLSGWHRDAHGLRVGAVRVPVPTRYTLLSAVGSALVLCTVPLSYTFIDVSIPFIQLLMRGDILVVAPLVDLMFGRRVRWWSWVALGIVAVAVAIVVGQRGGLAAALDLAPAGAHARGDAGCRAAHRRHPAADGGATTGAARQARHIC